MKHLFNFSPTVKYREGSSFMFKTILAILYAVPLLLLLLHGYTYFQVSAIEERLTAFTASLESKHEDVRKTIAEIRPDRQEFWKMMGTSVAYHRMLTNIRFSWSDLFERLEALIPEGVKVSRIRMKPASLTDIAIEGEAREVAQVTEFLRRLFAHPDFLRPRLSYHGQSKSDGVPGVKFRMSVSYLIQTGGHE